MENTSTVELGAPGNPVGKFPYLTITDNQGLATTFALDRGISWRIGREQGVEIVLADEAVSRRHAAIQRSEWGEYYVLDLGSRNGTFVCSQRVRTPAILRDGDSITVGSYSLIFRGRTSSARIEPAIAASEDQMNLTRLVFSERLISVLVVDIRNYTGLAQSLAPETLCSFIHDWFSDASRIFRAQSCWTMKYIGDAIMATWLHDGDTDQAPLLAALRAVDELAAITVPERYSLSLQVRFSAGLNTGLASTGNAGFGDETDFTALGDTVNAAFRIEAGTRQVGSDVAMGSHCVKLLGGESCVSPYLREYFLELKGYADRVPVWAGSFENARGLQAALARNNGDRESGHSPASN